MKIRRSGSSQCDAILSHLDHMLYRCSGAFHVALEVDDHEGTALLNKLYRDIQQTQDYFLGVGEVKEKEDGEAFVITGECWICGRVTSFQYYNLKPPTHLTCDECMNTYIRLLREGPMKDSFEMTADSWAITTAMKRVKKPKALDEDVTALLYRQFGVPYASKPSVKGENDVDKEGKNTTEGSC